jgi:hypothetical protein
MQISLLTLMVTFLVFIFSIFKFINSKVSNIYKTMEDKYVTVNACKIIDTNRNKDINRLDHKLDKILDILLKPDK